MPLAYTRFIDIEYEQHGPLGGQPVVLLHGFPDSLRCWDRVIELLKNENLRLIVPHLRGYGATHVKDPEAMSCQTAALAQDVLDLADSLNIEKFHLVGHDWGARTAYSVAIVAPQRLTSLLALSTPYLMFQGKRESPEQIRAYWYQWYFNTERGRAAFQSDPWPLYEFIWRTWSPEWNFLPDEFAAAKPALQNPQLPPFVLSYYRHRYGNAPGAPAYAEQQKKLDPFPHIDVPTLFGCGLADAVNLPASSQGQDPWFPRAFERIEFPGVGHFPQRESPAEVAALIRRVVKT